MADSAQEKTEQATPKKASEAAKKGQIAYSKELTGAVIFLCGIAMIKGVGDSIFAMLSNRLQTSFRLPTESFVTTDPSAFLGSLGAELLGAVGPIFAAAFFITLIPGLMQTKLVLSTKKLEPELSKLNPLKGIKKLFSLNSVVTTIQNLVKMALVGMVVWVTIAGAMPVILKLSGAPLPHIVAETVDLIFLMGFRVAAGLFAVGILDLFYRIWKHKKDLMMSKEDVKEERKKSEGDPKIKAKIKSIQMSLAMQRMQQDVKTADVVVRNPTHFAVALKYDSDANSSPMVVAKGRGHMALRIIKLAEDAGVEVVENRPLARELHRSVEVGEVIPERLFKAVAAVLAFVFKKKNKMKFARS
ncbi:MAG: flagellar biosynthetic protein FlhB [Planctomycetota bacterium]|jgi:flagellar biosynthetic protein FlhB